MLRKIPLYTVFLILLFITDGFSQEFTDYQIWEEASAGNFFGVGARAMGMGGAQIATADDASALVYNPALLTKIKRIEFSGTMSHQRLKNETGFIESPRENVGPYFQNQSITQTNTRFSSANIVLPVPTYRGGLVFALGFNRMKSFDRAFHSILVDSDNVTTLFDASVLETGGINMWSLGGAIDLSPNISVGGAVNYWQGEDDYLQDYYLLNPNKLSGYEIWEKNRYLDSYSGWNGKLGFSVQPNKYLSLGAVVDFPTKFSIDQDYSFYLDSLNATRDTVWVYEDEQFGHYDLTHPYSFGAGTALSFKYFTLAGDVYYTDWSQMEGKGVDNKLIKENYQEVVRWHIGAEVVMPEFSTKFRVGYYVDPIPFKTVYLETDRRYFTLGAGFLIDQVMTLDIAWNHGFHEFRDSREQFIKEAYTTDKFFVGLAYRL
ncbi:MAG: outer membrane protein transport protein [Candidatus Zixiibacteriota bacterium]